jgi:hypothetical protein
LRGFLPGEDVGLTRYGNNRSKELEQSNGLAGGGLLWMMLRIAGSLTMVTSLYATDCSDGEESKHHADPGVNEPLFILLIAIVVEEARGQPMLQLMNIAFRSGCNLVPGSR